MTGKRAAVALIAALLAFGYVFTLNPGMVEFQIYPGAGVKTSLALVLFLFFLAGFGVAVFGSAFREALRSFAFRRTERAVVRRDEAQNLLVAGREQAVAGHRKRARRLFQKAYRKLPDHPLVQIEMARVELEEGRLPDAERRLKSVLKDDPANAEVLSLLVRVYREKGDFEGQVATLSRWLDVDPDQLQALFALRDLYREAGNWGEAVRVQEKIVAKADARTGRAAERQTLVAFRYRRATAGPAGPDRALLERLVRDERGFAPAHLALGEALLAAGERDAAVDAWIRGYNATGQVGLLLRAETERDAAGRSDDMLKLYRRLARKRDAVPLLLARYLLAHGQPEEARAVLDKLHGPAADSRVLRLLQGEALFRLREFEQAARAWRQAWLGEGEAVVLPFTCSGCGATAAAWAAVCPRCNRVDGLALDLSGAPASPALPAP